MSASLKSTVMAIAAARDHRQQAASRRHDDVNRLQAETEQMRKQNQHDLNALSKAIQDESARLRQTLSNDRATLAASVGNLRREMNDKRNFLKQTLSEEKARLRETLSSENEARLSAHRAFIDDTHHFLKENRARIDVINDRLHREMADFNAERKEGLKLWNEMLGVRRVSTPKKGRREGSSTGSGQFAIQIPFAPSQRKENRS